MNLILKKALLILYNLYIINTIYILIISFILRNRCDKLISSLVTVATLFPFTLIRFTSAYGCMNKIYIQFE